jgi:hypothetical protein
MRACVAMAMGLTEGALGVRGLKKDEIEYELDWCDVNEARLTDSKHLSRASMQYIH